jgi:thiamine transporter ThiT
MQNDIDDYLSPQHRTLRLIATASGILAYIALAFFALRAFASLFSVVNMMRLYQTDNLLQQQRYDIATLEFGMAFFTHLLSGVVFWVLLTGLSLGLRMVIETDVNYRLGATEADNAEADNA